MMRDGRGTITISLYAAAVDSVTVSEAASGVSLVLGDDLSGIAILGPLDVVHRLVVEAERQLSQLTVAPAPV